MLNLNVYSFPVNYTVFYNPHYMTATPYQVTRARTTDYMQATMIVNHR